MSANKSDIYKLRTKLNHHNEPIIIALNIKYISLIPYIIYGIIRLLNIH